MHNVIFCWCRAAILKGLKRALIVYNYKSTEKHGNLGLLNLYFAMPCMR